MPHTVKNWVSREKRYLHRYGCSLTVSLSQWSIYATLLRRHVSAANLIIHLRPIVGNKISFRQDTKDPYADIREKTSRIKGTKNEQNCQIMLEIFSKTQKNRTFGTFVKI